MRGRVGWLMGSLNSWWLKVSVSSRLRLANNDRVNHISFTIRCSRSLSAWILTLSLEGEKLFFFSLLNRDSVCLTYLFYLIPLSFCELKTWKPSKCISLASTFQKVGASPVNSTAELWEGATRIQSTLGLFINSPS